MWICEGDVKDVSEMCGDVPPSYVSGTVPVPVGRDVRLVGRRPTISGTELATFSVPCNRHRDGAGYVDVSEMCGDVPPSYVSGPVPVPVD